MREAIGAACKKELDAHIEKTKELRYTVMRYSDRANAAYKIALISLILNLSLITYIILTA
jgi:hypothetical protein